MSEITNTDFAEFGAIALDGYQELFENPKGLDHRTNISEGLSLLSDLLADLMHYADERGVDFDHALAQARTDHTVERAESGTYEIGATVQLTGPEAGRREHAGLTTRGQVTGVLSPQGGSATFYVQFPGEASGHPFPEPTLLPAPRFPPTVTSTGVVGTPLAAEAALVAAILRIEKSDAPGSAPRMEDLRDHRTLLTSLSSWTGLDERRFSELLRPKIFAKLRQLDVESAGEALSGSPTALEPPNPRADSAQLAAQDFPRAPGEDPRRTGPSNLDQPLPSQLRPSRPTTRIPTTPPGPAR
ncbi:hypothetical protein J4573_08585 [Actinomadura barringtoniae]|uniref:Uncharacterized protein n=1 Tax=Actinomadura barringtoniae TaxID=1427535 RepID=A0A939P7M7_9ACTN|nr:hypothetical protein [Actinomadura barringtoniae]MBO2447140.1 hypothetical protein [Actinomadura barringtoniae]